MNYIDVDKEAIPYTFTMDIGGNDYNFKINYNERFDFFTIDLYDDNGDPIVLGEKIVYGRALFSSFPDESKLPPYPITPFDAGGHASKVGWDELNVSVFLYIGDDEE